MLPVAYMQQIFQYPMLRSRILLRSFEELLGVHNIPQIEVARRLCPECIPDGIPYDIFCGSGAMSGKEGITIEVPVSVKDSSVRH
jgi:hypothetical protein